MMYDLRLFAINKETSITHLNASTMDEIRLFACGMAIGANVKYKHVKVRLRMRQQGHYI